MTFDLVHNLIASRRKVVGELLLQCCDQITAFLMRFHSVGLLENRPVSDQSKCALLRANAAIADVVSEHAAGLEKAEVLPHPIERRLRICRRGTADAARRITLACGGCESGAMGSLMIEHRGMKMVLEGRCSGWGTSVDGELRALYVRLAVLFNGSAIYSPLPSRRVVRFSAIAPRL